MQAQAIPRSTIVLAVLTCIPFGLAIRDVVNGRNMSRAEAIAAYHGDGERPTPVESDDEDYREVAKRLAIEENERQARLEKEREEERAWSEKSKAMLRTLYDAEVATIGSAFESIKLGEKITVRPGKNDDYSAMLIDNGAVAHALWIEPKDRRYCEMLSRQLYETWEVGRRHDGNTVWVNEHAGQRAVYGDPGTCSLKFEKIAPLASWLDRTQKSIVPLWAVGQPLATLKAVLGDKALEVQGQLTWTDYGLGAGTGPTQLTAYSENGRVTGVLAAFKTDPDTQDQLIDRISLLTGRQPHDDAPIWKSNPPFELQSGAQIFLHIGKQPK